MARITIVRQFKITITLLLEMSTTICFTINSVTVIPKVFRVKI